MTDTSHLLKLMSWLSPVFPIGGFAYSAGLEQAVHAGHVSDQKSLADWISVQITQGAQWNDAVLLVEAHRRAGDLRECVFFLPNECNQIQLKNNLGNSLNL